MLNPGLLIVIALLYIAVLFVIAWRADQQSGVGANRNLQATIYSLSLAVYCTSWTFYGAVGSAATTGWGFLAIYVGPALVFLLGHGLIRRIAETSKDQRITSIADYIAYRYGRSHSIAVVVTVAAFIGSIPYIALQLKAIITGFEVVTRPVHPDGSAPIELSLYVALALALFAMLFGTRTMDASEHHRGLMWAIAFESLVKLMAFLAIGLFVIFGVFNGLGDVASALRDNDDLHDLFSPWRIPEGFGVQLVLSMAAILCLPRQFHVAVVEYRNARELSVARWAFPLYLLLFAALVVPIALGGLTLFAGQDVNPDTYVLALPIASGQETLAVLAFIGGFSAATGMVIVASVALAIMISNDLVMPLLLRSWKRARGTRGDLSATLLWVRRLAILAIVLLAYIYIRAIDTGVPLASIGLLSFAAVAQFAPAMLIGLYWPRASRVGALFGLSVGMVVWFFALLLPSIGAAMELGFAVPNVPFNEGAIWSLVLNSATMVLFSILVPDRQRRGSGPAGADGAGGMITLGELHRTIGQFLGFEESRTALATHIGEVDFEPGALAAPATIQFCERVLAGSIGTASARTVLTTALNHRGMGRDAVRELLDRTSAAVQFNRELLESTLDNLSQGVSVVDQDLRVVGWNKRYLEMMSYPEGSVWLGQSVEELIRINADRGFLGEVDADEEVRKRLEHLRSGQSYRIERRWHDGKMMEIQGNPMPGGGYVTTFTDITHFKEIESKLQEINETLEHRVEQRTRELREALDEVDEARQAAESANQSKNRFLAAASHDLLQPMNAARLFVSLLRQHKGGAEEQAKLVKRVDRSLTAAEELLSALLDISKFDSGTYQTNMETLSIEALFDQLRRRLEPLARNRGLELRVRSAGQQIHTDRALLYRILQNFLANALRYTEEGGVLLACRVRGDAVKISVWDTGVGIGAEDLESVFQEFHRLDYAQRLEERGLGLGLAICDRIARTLGVAISVWSRPGQGSCFSVTVPQAQPGQVARSERGVAESIDEARQAGLSVLCIDNEPDILDGMKLLLEGWGHTVHPALGQKEALRTIAQQGVPHIVLVDYHLKGGENGLGVMDVIEREVDGLLPAIVITADRSTALEETVRKRGYGLLRKPIKPAALRALINNTVKSRGSV